MIRARVDCSQLSVGEALENVIEPLEFALPDAVAVRHVRLSVSCTFHLQIAVVEVRVIADGNIAVIFCRLLGKMLDRGKVLHIPLDRRQGGFVPPHIPAMCSTPLSCTGKIKPPGRRACVRV